MKGRLVWNALHMVIKLPSVTSSMLDDDVQYMITPPSAIVILKA